MKRLFLLIIIIIAFTSCTKHYMQLSTLCSNNVFLDDDSYVYKDDFVAIDYFFCTKDGVFQFAILNVSDRDIYIDLEKSVFVYDKMVYDYAVKDISITSYSESSYTDVSGYILHLGSNFYSDASSVSKGVAVTSTAKAPSVVLIPKGSYRIFSGYDLNETIYRQIFFARDPKKDEVVCLSKDEITKPIEFSNIICVKNDYGEYTIRNNFEVCEIRNVLLLSNNEAFVKPNIYYAHYTNQFEIN